MATSNTHRRLKTKDKVYIGGYIDPSLRAEVAEIATCTKRSVNAVLEIFLTRGVFHHKELMKATGVSTLPDKI